MALTPLHGLAPPGDDEPLASIEAEQALLGILLYDNESFLNLPEGVAGAFYEPFHNRLYASIAAAVAAGLGADPMALHEEFRFTDKAYKDLGGMAYLADLLDRSPPAANLPDYARVVTDLARRREIVALAGEMQRHARQNTMTASDIVATVERDLLGLRHAGSAQGLVSLGDAVDSALAYVDDRSVPVGVRSGIPALDQRVGPMLPGDLVVVGARPSMGKSAIAVALSMGVAAPGLAAAMNGLTFMPGAPKAKGVIQIHAEMTFGDTATGGQAVRRHIADMGYHLFGADFPTYRDIRDKKVSDAQRAMMADAAHALRQVPIVGLKRTRLTLSAIRAMVRRQAHEWAKAGIELGMVVIDHVGLLKGEGKFSGRYEEQTEIAMGAKELAEELACVLVPLVQLNRGVENRDDKRPQLSDLRESGAWEENADVVAMLYRESYYAQREPEPKAGDLLKLEDWSRRRASKALEVLYPKIREGEGGSAARIWCDVAHNAVRQAEPAALGELPF